MGLGTILRINLSLILMTKMNIGSVPTLDRSCPLEPMGPTVETAVPISADRVAAPGAADVTVVTAI